MRIYYKSKNGVCLTKCIANHPQKVSSMTCCKCKHFNFNNRTFNYIECLWVESVLKRISTEYPKLYSEYIVKKNLMNEIQDNVLSIKKILGIGDKCCEN